MVWPTGKVYLPPTSKISLTTNANTYVLLLHENPCQKRHYSVTTWSDSQAYPNCSATQSQCYSCLYQCSSMKNFHPSFVPPLAYSYSGTPLAPFVRKCHQLWPSCLWLAAKHIRPNLSPYTLTWMPFIHFSPYAPPRLHSFTNTSSQTGLTWLPMSFNDPSLLAVVARAKQSHLLISWDWILVWLFEIWTLLTSITTCVNGNKSEPFLQQDDAKWLMIKLIIA